ncbi:hypothetical protein FMEAI12_6450002 [Parafrankia sp. Ea1.12]|nr:hypothetical protein FMEAI12_6450002 [Parafrankia sp. Ea1.12]
MPSPWNTPAACSGPSASSRNSGSNWTTDPRSPPEPEQVDGAVIVSWSAAAPSSFCHEKNGRSLMMRKSRLLGATVACCAALVLGACGGGDSSPSTGTAGPSGEPVAGVPPGSSY